MQKIFFIVDVVLLILFKFYERFRFLIFSHKKSVANPIVDAGERVVLWRRQ